MNTLLELRGADKIYGKTVETRALGPTNLEINRGELVVILGTSGSGKSTLLNLMGGLDAPSNGQVLMEGTDLGSLSANAVADFRRDKIGFIFQFYNLIPSLTAWENVELAAALSHSEEAISEVLHKVGLSDIAHHFPGQMSGGQQQRVAIARALVKNPQLLLCDEPTGALDFETGKAILGLLEDLVHRANKTVIIVTHNSALAAMATRLIRLKDGMIITNEVRTDYKPAAALTW